MARGLLVAAVILVGATCRLSDLIGTPKGAIIDVRPVAPNVLSDSAALGSTALREDSISVTNIGGGELHWTASSKQGSTWLLLPVDSGTAPTPLMVHFDPEGLPIGVYRDTVVVQATTGGGSGEVPVRLEIHPCRPTSIQVSDARTDTLNAADCGAPHLSGSQAQLFSFTGQAGDSASIELTAGFDGHLFFDTTDTPTGPPLGEADGCLGDNANPCLYYVRLPRDGTYYIEVTSASAADSGLFNLRLLHPGRFPGAPDSLDQRLLDSTTSVVGGATVGTSSLLLRAFVSDSDRVDSLYLEAEVQPVGTPFTNSSNHPPGPMVGNGQPAWVRVSGLTDNTQYHWQVRTKDWTGRPSPWVPFPANPAFSIQLGNNPNPLTGLNQFQSDGSTMIPIGQTANGTTVVFKAQVSDPDAGNTLQLQVEVQPIGANFDSIADASSAPVASGATAVVSVAGLSGGVSYHWQARAVDNTGRSSAWVSFPTPAPNPEGDADFRVEIPPQQLVFTVQPAVDTSGRPIRPAVQVAVQDQNGNTITSFIGPVTMAIANNPAGGTLTGTTAVNANAGIATFSNLIIDKAGTGYTLQATTGTVSSVPSAPFNVVAGPATQLAFTVQPSNTPATSPITPPVVVTARDAAGNTATSYTSNVTIAILNNPGNPPGTLSGTTTVAANAGQAQFGNLSINNVGNGYTLRATSGTLTAAVSAPFNITNIGSTHLTFSNQPTTTGAGVAINSGTGGVVVTAVDDVGQPVTSYTGSVTITIGNNPGGGTLTGGGPITAVNGVATFSNLRIDRVGTGYTLTATGTGGATAGASAAFNITAGPTSQLVFTVPPSNATAGTAITPAVQVSGQDQFGNATSFTGPVTITIANDPTGGAATLTGGGPINAINGVATFSNLRINRTGIGYTLRAASGTLVPDTSMAFNIAAAPPVSLVFTTQPGTTTAGVAINSGTGGVVVTARDSLGNTATGFNGSVSTAIATGPVGGTLTGTTSVSAAAGVATFSNLRIKLVGSYTLQASTASPALTSAPSAGFNIVPAPPFMLTFTTQPTNTAVLARIDSAVGGVVVTVQDSVGNTTPTFSGQVRIILGTSAGGTLTGGGFITPVAGVATFPSLTLNVLGTYSLVTTSTGPSLISDESVLFDIIPGPAKSLIFSVHPSQTVAGQIITPAVQVTARDIQGNTASGFNGNVTVAIGTNGGTPPGTLSGTLQQPAAGGIANFPNLSINNAGPGYTLTAATPALPSGPVTGATSNPFNIISGGVSPTLSTITRAPTSITASGGTITSTITVTARDNLNNPIQGLTVVLAATGSTNFLTQPVATTNASGVATGTLASTVAETKTVSATIDGTLINATTTVVVNPAAPKLLLFNVGPNTTVATQIIRPATGVQVEVRDTFNNRVTGASNSVNIAILFNAGTPVPGTLSGTTPRTPVGGIVTFNDLSIDKVGTGYTLLTSSAGLVSDTSAQFNITVGAATKLGFVQQPTNTAGGAAITPAISVEVQDAGGNRVTSSSVPIGIAILNNAGGGTLSGDNNNPAVSGVATFSGMSIDNAGTGYTLQATATGLTPATSSAFDITIGGAAKLGFVQQPTQASGGATISPAVTVEIQDAGGNRVLGATNSVTLAIGVNAGPGAALSGTNPVSAINGLATFSNLSIDSAGTGYTLVATSGALTQTTSTAFNITVGAATKLGFRVQPSNTAGGAAITPAIEVEVRDAGGNRVSSSSANVTLAIASNPGGGALSGDSVNNAMSGVASFDLSINNAGTGYTLLATATGLTSATSAAFNITVGAATKLGFVQQPTQASGGATISPAVTVEILDAGDNRVNSSAMVSLAIGTNPGPSAALTGGGAVAAVNGLATFSNLTIDSAGTGYTLVATSGALTQATSNAFDITVGAAAKLGFVQQPTPTGGGGTIAPAITVAVQDAGGNRVTGGAPRTVDIAILNNAGGGTLSGDVSNNTSSGLATFSDLSIDLAGTGYTLRATSSGLTGVTSNGFNIVVGAPAKLAFLQQPTSEIAGVAIAPAITVRILDAGNNLVGTATNTVDIAILNNAGGGTLSGDASNPASGGVSTFNNLSIDKTGTGYTLHATSGVLTAATSTGFNISHAAADHLTFTVQPSNTQAGQQITPAVKVEIRDAFDNLVTNATDDVTLVIGNDPSGGLGTLSGGGPLAAAGGVATFASLSIDVLGIGDGYTLNASATGMTGAGSASFNITP